MNRILSIARAALVFAAAFTLAPAQAQTFNSEIRLSNQAGPSIHPNVAAAGTNVFVVWVEYPTPGTKGDIYFSRSTNSGVSFSAPVNLTNTAGIDERLPQIATNGTQVFITYTDDPLAGELFVMRSVDSGATFGAAVQLSNSTAPGYSRPGAVYVDTANNVHVAWYDSGTTGGAYGQIFYRCSGDLGASYSAAVNVTQFDGQVDAEAPRLAQTADGVLYLMYRATRNGLPFAGFPPFDQYMVRTNGPVSGCSTGWLRPPQKVSVGLPHEFANTYGALFVPGAGNVLHVGYWSDKAGTNLLYRRGFPVGKGFETPADVSSLGASHPQWDGTVPELSGFGLGEDAAGKVHLVFAENNHLRDSTFQSGPLYYRCSNDGGATWVSRTLASGQAETSQPRGVYANNRFHMVWMDWRDNNTGAEIYYRSVTTGACSAAAVQLSLNTNTVNFGGQSMGTTSPAQTVTVTNTGAATLNVSAINFDNAQFTQTNNCATVAPTAACTVNIFFTPTAAAGALNSTTSVGGTMSITSNAAGSPHTVTVLGTGEKSLITHYYRSILRRAPDSGGKTFWEGEDVRMQGLGANVNETWYSMAQFFYFSPEYVAFNRDDSGFVSDLYNTFFNRPADTSGLNFWVGQIQQGMPREVVLVGFMISPEFNTFAQGIFGNTAARAEVDMVGDFYRGILARLPDTGGLNAWVSAFRNSQCQGANASASVNATVESISTGFITSGEYVTRARTNAQYVGDLYNAFLRRAGDLAGVQFWINSLNTAALTRDQVRLQFKASSEFQARVNAVIAAGCVP